MSDTIEERLDRLDDRLDRLERRLARLEQLLVLFLHTFDETAVGEGPRYRMLLHELRSDASPVDAPHVEPIDDQPA